MPQINGIRWTSDKDLGVRDSLVPPKTINLTVSHGLYVNVYHVSPDEYQNGDERVWPVERSEVEGLIRQVLETTNAFREKYATDYIDQLDPVHLESQLQNFQLNSPFNAFDNLVDDEVDTEHKDIWRRISITDELRELAFYGNLLYKKFFPRDQFEDLYLLPAGSQINISWCKSTNSNGNWLPHVPWGLMFRTEPPENSEVNPMDFLGLRYRIGYVAYRDKKKKTKTLGSIDSTNRIHCLYWGDREKILLDEVSWQKTKLQLVPNQIFAPNLNTQQLKSQVVSLFRNPNPQPVNLLYFFCRCSIDGGGSRPILQFGNDNRSNTDIIKAVDIVTENELLDQPLVFANACSTVAADPYITNELEANFFERGCRAFIGTETKVPVIFASRFSFIFFYLLYTSAASQPISTGEAITQSRLFLWRYYRNIGGILYSYIGEYGLFMADRDKITNINK